MPTSAPSERLVRAHAQAAIVHMRPTAARGGEDLLAHGVVDHRMFQAPADLAGDRDCEDRHGVQEIRGAIQRIDDPHRLAVAADAALFRQKSMIGVGLADTGDDLPLGGLVHLGHEVIAPLGGDRQGVHPLQAADDDLTGTAGGTNGNIEKWLHGK